MEPTGKLIDISVWKELLVNSGEELVTKLSGFLPQLLAALAILVLGFLIARAIELATSRILKRVGLDRVATRIQLSALLERSDIHHSASQIVGKAVFWIVMLTAFLSSVDTIGLTAVTSTIDRLIAYIPNLIGAGLIAVLGVLAARVAGSIARSAAVAADFKGAARMGLVAQWGVVILVAIVATEQLGVATDILIAPLTAIVGAVTLSAGLSVALGARPIVTHILAGHFLRRSLPAESLVVVEGEQGLIESVGATETRLRGESKSWSVPNGRLLDGVVTWI